MGQSSLIGYKKTNTFTERIKFCQSEEFNTRFKSSIITQKGESHNGCFKKTKHVKISERTCAYQGGRNVRFWEKLLCFVFLKQPFWDSPFCLVTVEIRPFHKVFDKTGTSKKLWMNDNKSHLPLILARFKKLIWFKIFHINT